MTDYKSLAQQWHTIASPHDMTVRVLEYEMVDQPVGGRGVEAVNTAVKVHHFEVSSEVLTKTEFFQRMLADEHKENIIDLEVDHWKAVGVWLKILHDDGLKNAHSKDVSLFTIWHMLVVADRYGLDTKAKEAKSWFAAWFFGKDWTDYDQCRMLLLPCYTFDHAFGFARATRTLAYKAASHITELRPRGFVNDQFSLPKAVIRKL